MMEINKEDYIQITKDLYKATLLFPKKEPFRYKLRELAVNILADPNDDDFETLDSLFEVAKSQNWVRASEILAIQSNYANLRGVLRKIEQKKTQDFPMIYPEAADKKISAQTPEEKPAAPYNGEPPAESEARSQERRPEVSGREKNKRQEKIIDFLKENERAQVWEVKRVFPQVSKRTLRRDFEFLLKQGTIQRIGERNNTFYQIKSI